MLLTRHQKASQEEIDALTALIAKVDGGRREKKLGENEPANEFKASDGRSFESREAKTNLFRGGIAHVPLTREPLRIDNPVQWLLMLMPELTPYKWQFEELMHAAGYLENGKYDPHDKTAITKKNPLNSIICAANGSGKDAVLIAAFATWFVVSGTRNRVVATSSSFEQLKGQTEIHIRELIKRANARFGNLFKSIHFHHIVPELGGEIKLFATDDPGMAEGYHAFHGGKLARIINEAKTVTDAIYDATERWTGVTHTLLISSPGKKRGMLFNLARSSGCVNYPSSPILGSWYFRRVTAFECPHLPAEVIQAKIDARPSGENDPWVQSAIFANFTDVDEPVVIPQAVLDACIVAKIEPVGDDIAIGLDLAAGGDESGFWVRRGNTTIHKYFFRQGNAEVTAALLDNQLSPWKWGSYVLNADNGGVGRGTLDIMAGLGWRVTRRNNQSPAMNKREFINFGAESWSHVKRLMERKLIPIPNDAKLREQLTTRYYIGDENSQGKLQLESKKDAALAGRKSPDRADAFVLCYWNYKPGIVVATKPVDGEVYIPLAEFVAMSRNGIPRWKGDASAGRFTSLTGPLVSKHGGWNG